MTPTLVRGGRYRFAFNDLLMMRMAKEMLPGRSHLEPLQRCFERVRSFFDPSRPVTSFKLENDIGRIIVRCGDVLVEAESGQILLPLDGAPAAGKVEEGFGPARVRKRFEEARRVAESDPLRALTIFRELLGSQPYGFEAHMRMAALLEREGDTLGAVRHLQGAVAIAPTNAEAHLKLGLLYRKRDENENALGSFQRAVEYAPDLIEAHRNLAELYEQAGRKRDALRHLSAIHRLSRDN